MAGDMPKDWKVATLGSCGVWYSGGTPNTAVAEYWNGDIPWITASSLHEFYITDSERRVTELGIRNGTRLMPTNTILFVVRGMSLKTEFRVGIARRPMAFGQDCKAIIARPDIEPLFLANALRAKASEILNLADEASHGTGRLQTDPLTQLEIDIPPISEQRAITHVIGTLDDKIELNRRMNETLEVMARAMFKQWFVDGAEEEWEVGKLGDITENIRRGAQPNEIEPETPYIGLEHMPRRSIALSEWGQAEQVTSNKFWFKRGEILFGKLRPYFHKVGVAPIDGVCSTDILVIAPKSPEWFGLALSYLSSDALVAHTNTSSTGTRMPRTNWEDIARYEILVPPLETAQTFSQHIVPIVEKIRANIFQSRTLAILRDALLPKLMSGEVRVR
jgi:type I restriction enzyme S subunit